VKTNSGEKINMRNLIAAAAAALTLAAAPAMALEVTASKTIAAQAGAVWTAIGDFCGVSKWHPAVEKCELSVDKKREVRTLTLKGGGTIVEKLGARDAEGMAYVYALMSGPLPVANYRSKLSVAPTKDGGAAVATWQGRFNPAKGKTAKEAKEVIAGVYKAGLDGLEKVVTAK
jgi:hypothetical protein